jgi:uracil phosphoribosyltransferase
MQTDPRHPNLTVLDHPLVRHKVDRLRMSDTPTKTFKELVKELSLLLAYEATRDLPVEDVPISTPLETFTGTQIRGKKTVLVPILRAGLGMVAGAHEIIPAARVGHVGLYRDEETLEPVEYYANVPSDVEERPVLVLDPMLATGGSASAAIDVLKKRGARRIRMANLVAAPEGVTRMGEDHPDVHIFVAALDRGLNGNGYILPGLGDAGDRLFGTR